MTEGSQKIKIKLKWKQVESIATAWGMVNEEEECLIHERKGGGGGGGGLQMRQTKQGMTGK